MEEKINTTSFWELFESRTEAMENEGRWGSAINYAKAERSLKSFIGDKPLSLSDITPKLIKDYNWFLYSKGLLRNTVSQYNRVIRAVYNYAVNEGMVEDCKPFRTVCTRIDKTTKRALPEADIARIASARTNGLPQDHAKDMFLFSYLTCGMTFVDMVYLKKKDVFDDCLVYFRRKTGTRIEVQLEPAARAICEKYSRLSGDSPYVFPILGNRTGKEAYRRMTSALAIYNRELKKISELAGTNRKLSSYVSRHSWATAARNNGADISTVSEALGHRSEKTTRIYLASFDRSRIEKVNHRIVNNLKQFGYHQ